ncbi:MAG: sigma 54-interacting transcriptional regulator [Gemmatimonadaceae bacterium]
MLHPHESLRDQHSRQATRDVSSVPTLAPAGPFLASRSPGFRSAIAQLERFAKQGNDHVLLLGESGTGKTVFAERLHACSPRADRIFHRVSLASVTDTLAPSALFGHLPGAFTDARSKRAGHFITAHGGTLFLDEIGKASEVVQARLLDAVERNEIVPLGADRSVRIDVRIVAATNVDLHDLVDQGKFLPDLLARLDGFAVRIPPLRERRDDIALLVAHLVSVRHERYGYRKAPTIDSDLMEALCGADWPGNVRELDVTVRRLLVDAQGAPIITLGHCTDSLLYLRPSKATRATPDEVLAEVRKDGNVAGVARKFGLSRTTVYRYMQNAAVVAAAAIATDLAM